jgi:transcriptional regulator with XRE-family HTH domain
LRHALASYDFGRVFTAVRAQAGLSQLKLAGLLALSQARVSDVERGVRRLRDVALIARVATALGIPARLLGFPSESASSVAVKEVSWLHRRDFISLVTAATVGSNLHPELARLEALLPSHTEPVTRPRIGAADVDAVESITDAFRRSGSAHGGGLCRAAAIAQLHQVRRLEDATCSEDVRLGLRLATADLAMMAAYVSYDVEEHDSARRLWTFALDTARRAEDHPRSTDLAVNVLLDIADQALHLDRPREALHHVQLASATAASGKYTASAITGSVVSAYLGWCRASLGEVEACRRAMGQAHEEFAGAHPGSAPPWAQHVTDAVMSAEQGNSLYLLSLTDPDFAPAAIQQLRSAVDGFGIADARGRAISLPGLAGAYFRAGDLDSAVATGHEAVSAISELSSTRAYARLQVLDTIADPFGHKPEVAELREHIRTTLTPA